MNPLIEIINVNEEVSIKTSKVEKRSGKRIGYYYIIIKSLKESLKNDVIKCMYIKGLTNFGLCVIKEGTYGDSKDKEGRDIKDRLIWQEKLHAELQNKVRIPKLLGSFEENNNYYLVIEYIKGKSLSAAIRENNKNLVIANPKRAFLQWRSLEYIMQVSSLLSKLHEYDYVHRDVTPANFMITTNGKVYMIDMELSYSLKNITIPPFQLGTFGYMSPQQKKMDPPNVKDDVFSLGVIILEAMTGINANKVVDSDYQDIERKIHFLIKDNTLAELIITCLNPKIEFRPSTKIVYNTLFQYINDLKKKISRPMSILPSIVYRQDQILDIVQEAIRTLSSPLLFDSERGWFSEDVHKETPRSKNKINKAWYASFSIGAAGILYLLSRAHKVGIDISSSQFGIDLGLSLIEERYINKTEKTNPHLLNGSAGIAISIYEMVQEKLIPENHTYVNWINKLLSVDNQQLDLENGIAGQGLALLSCKQVLSADIVKCRTTELANQLRIAQKSDGSWENENAKNKKFRLGSGSTGIILFLLEYGNLYNNQEALITAQKGLQGLLEHVVKRNEYINWPWARRKEMGYGILTGNAGIIYTLLRAYKIFGSTAYKDAAKMALFHNHRYIVHPDFSQESGLSGLGEVYLDAANILQEEEWLERANWIAQLLIQMKHQHLEYGPYWHVNVERQPLPAFMQGNSGILHFLLRICKSDVLGMPLLSIN